MTGEEKASKLSAVLTVLVIVGGIALAVRQPGGKELQRKFLEEERRAGRISGLPKRRRRRRA